MNRWAVIELAIVWVLTWGLVPHVLAQKTKSPVATLAWVWSIFLLPVVGAVFYLLFGSERVQRRRLKMISELREATETGMGVQCGVADLALQMPELQRINGFHATGCNAVTPLVDGVSFFPRLLEVIRGATHYLHVEFYIWHTDAAGRAVRDELVAAAKRGVKVRLLLDEIGSLWTPRRFFRDLEAAGGRFSWFKTFAPLRGSFHLNLRNHRKLVVADGTVALTGGMNVGDEYWTGSGKTLPYRDLQMEVRGPAASQLSWHFAQDWHFATGEALKDPALYPPQESAGPVTVQIISGGPDNDLNEIQLSVLSLLHRAKSRVWMMTPYFVPEAPLMSALQLAAMRGVDVRLLVPQKGDHRYLTAVTRSYYEGLLPHGVRIYEYRPRMLHAKLTTIDGTFSMAGSANLDIRSLRINFELNLLLSSPDIAAHFDALFERDFAQADRIRWMKFQLRPLRQKVAEAVCRPLAPLL